MKIYIFFIITEDELEIMAVLSCQEIVPLDIEEYGDMQTRMHLNTVTFYDSNTYEKLREFQIDQKIKSGSYGGCKVSMDLDRDVLLIRIKMDSNKTKTLLWKLQWCDNLDSGNKKNRAIVHKKQIRDEKFSKMLISTSQRQ